MQPSLFDQQPEDNGKATGRQLRDKGIATALANADAMNKQQWTEGVWAKLPVFLKSIGAKTFLCEQFRKWCEDGGTPAPPTARAYGGIIKRAASEQLIVRVGHASVENPRAHMAICTVWQSKTELI